MNGKMLVKLGWCDACGERRDKDLLIVRCIEIRPQRDVLGVFGEATKKELTCLTELCEITDSTSN